MVVLINSRIEDRDVDVLTLETAVTRLSAHVRGAGRLLDMSEQANFAVEGNKLDFVKVRQFRQCAGRQFVRWEEPWQGKVTADLWRVSCSAGS